MKHLKNKLSGSHFFFVMQIVSMIYWLIWMKSSDSYYILYIIIGMTGLASYIDNIKNNVTIISGGGYFTSLFYPVCTAECSS